MLDVMHTKEGDVATLGLNGRLDSITAPAFEQALAKLLKEGNCRVVMACENLVFISSAGLRVLLAFAKQLKKQSGQMALCGVQPTVHAVLESSGFLGFLKLCASMDEAAAHVNPPK